MFTLENAEYGVTKDRQPLRNRIFAYSTVVLLVPRHLRILFLVGLEASLLLMDLKLKSVTLETIFWVHYLLVFLFCLVWPLFWFSICLFFCSR